MSDEKPPTYYGNDLSVPELALTKEQYEELMKTRRRNLTDGPIGWRGGTTGSPFTSLEADESIGDYARTKGDQ